MKRLVIILSGILFICGCAVVQRSNPNTAQVESETMPIKTETMQIEMIFVEGGTFTIGCTSEQSDICSDREKPAHQVTLSNFYIGKYPVTQAQWREIMGKDIRRQRDMVSEDLMIFDEGDNYPMFYVSWNEAQEFIKILNEKTDKSYRLPTEAEWEYAARGGNQSKGYKYSGSNIIDEVAWYLYNSDDMTHPVGTKNSNELGIYDMSGNISEWVSDWYENYSSNDQTDPKGPATGSFRVLRSGGWTDDGRRARVSHRFSSSPDGRDFDLGFRIASSSE